MSRGGALHKALAGLPCALGLLERRCCLCGEISQAPSDIAPHSNEQAVFHGSPPLCPACRDSLAPRLGGYCPLCGGMSHSPQHSQGAVRVCGRCSAPPRKDAPERTWNLLHFYAPYSGVLRACILAFKMEERLGLGALLRHLTLMTWLLKGAGGELPDLVAPVPLHPQRLRMRGFNQSMELARPLKKAGLRVEPATLVRKRPTVPQFTLQRSERVRNIRGAFAADKSLVKGRHVLLLDDIMTSGATIAECARTLRKSGAAKVDVLVLARTAEG